MIRMKILGLYHPVICKRYIIRAKVLGLYHSVICKSTNQDEDSWSLPPSHLQKYIIRTKILGIYHPDNRKYK